VAEMSVAERPWLAGSHTRFATRADNKRSLLSAAGFRGSAAKARKVTERSVVTLATRASLASLRFRNNRKILIDPSITTEWVDGAC